MLRIAPAVTEPQGQSEDSPEAADQEAGKAQSAAEDPDTDQTEQTRQLIAKENALLLEELRKNRDSGEQQDADSSNDEEEEFAKELLAGPPPPVRTS